MTDCPFCDVFNEPSHKDDIVAVIEDKYPVTRGHSLVIHKTHLADFFDYCKEDRDEMMAVVARLKDKLTEDLGVNDFNVGINCGSVAGQTVDHCHIHVIPRRKGDCEDPTGGIRNVIPGKGNYMKERRCYFKLSPDLYLSGEEIKPVVDKTEDVLEAVEAWCEEFKDEPSGQCEIEVVEMTVEEYENLPEN